MLCYVIIPCQEIHHGIFTVDDAALTSEATGEQMTGEFHKTSAFMEQGGQFRMIQRNVSLFVKVFLRNASSQMVFDANLLYNN